MIFLNTFTILGGCGADAGMEHHMERFADLIRREKVKPESMELLYDFIDQQLRLTVDNSAQPEAEIREEAIIRITDFFDLVGDAVQRVMFSKNERMGELCLFPGKEPIGFTCDSVLIGTRFDYTEIDFEFLTCDELLVLADTISNFLEVLA